MKLAKVKSSVYKKVLGVFGAAGFLVTFQACYGTPQNYVNVDGKITDNETDQGVGGLRVNIVSDTDSLTVTTDSTGAFYTGIISNNSQLQISVEDIDGDQNGKYDKVDTNITHDDNLIEIKLDKAI
jgi:putative lipoprotein (rSAM/lipoprotein system)